MSSRPRLSLTRLLWRLQDVDESPVCVAHELKLERHRSPISLSLQPSEAQPLPSLTLSPLSSSSSTHPRATPPQPHHLFRLLLRSSRA